MGAFLIVVAIVVGAATWELATETGGEFFAMYMVDPADYGASTRPPELLPQGRTRPGPVTEGEVANVLLAAAAMGAPVERAAATAAAEIGMKAEPVAMTPPPATPKRRAEAPRAEAPAETAKPNSGQDEGTNGSFDPAKVDPELTVVLALMGDTPHRQLDGMVFLPIAAHRVFGLSTVLGEHTSVPVTHELPGRVVVNPGSNSLVQARNEGFVAVANGHYPFVGQAVRQGDLLALLEPVNNHLDEAHTLERMQELTNQIDLTRKRMARLEEVIYVRYRDSKIEALRVEILGLQRQLDVLQRAVSMKYELRAKSNGVVSRVEVQVGQYVNQGETLFEIVDPSQLWVEATAFDPGLTHQVEGASAFTTDGRPLELRYIGGGLKLHNQATPLRFEVVNPPADLAVDNPVSVVVRTRTGNVEGVKVPRRALVRSADGREVVWERRSAERFVRHHVSSLPIDADHVLITSGLPANTRVVTRGTAALEQVR